MRNLLIYCLLWPLVLLSLAQGQEFSAYVNQRNPAVTEAFQLSFTVENGRASNLQYPDFSNFQVLRGPYTSQRTEIVNGKVSQSITYSFYLRPKKAGTFTIGPASATVDGKPMKTDPITIEVGPPTGNANPPTGNTTRPGDKQAQSNASIDEQLKDLIFLRVYVNKASAYVGEPVTISYKLFQHDRLSTYDLNAEDLPAYEGFWVENMKLADAARRPQREVIDGVSFVSNLIKRDLLIPQKVGKLDIGSMTTSIVVNVPTRQGSPFSLFERYQRHQYFFANAPITIDVKPLPTAGKPADFNGLIGEFEMATELTPQELDAGESLTFTLKIAGKGNLKDLREPQLNFPPDFEVFEPSIKENISVSGGTLVGSKTFEYPIVPRNPGEYKLPVFTLSYFDVNRRRYETLSSEQYLLKVGGEAQGAPQGLAGAVNRDDLELIGQDIRYLHTRDFDLQKQGETFFGSVGFWTLYLLPFLLMGGLLVWKNRQDKLAGDQAGTRRRKADKMARKRLSQAEKHLQASEEKAFYDEITRTLWGYLSDKLTLGQSELTRERVSRVLTEREVPTETIDQLKQLLDTCERALFAPSAAPGGMPGTYEQARNLITGLDDQL